MRSSRIKQNGGKTGFNGKHTENHIRLVLVSWGTGRYTLTILLVLHRSLSFLGAVVCQVSMLSTGETGADVVGHLSRTGLLLLWLLLDGGALLLLLLIHRTLLLLHRALLLLVLGLGGWRLIVASLLILLLLLSSTTVHWGLWIRAVAWASVGWAPLANHPPLAVFF